VNELGQVTSYTYDKLNRRIATTDSLGNITRTNYDSEDNIIATTDAIGNVTRYEYDKNNRRIKVIDAEGGITTTVYDAVGNVSSLTDSVGNKTSYTYDAVYRLITETNQLGLTRSYSYDAVGNQTQSIDRNGRKISYTYDVLNRQVSESWLNGSDRAINTFNYTYDAVSNLLTSNDAGSKYTYTYDAVNRITSVDNTGTSGVPAVKFSYGYDAVGNLLTVGDSINGVNGGLTAYTYDLLNRVTQLTQSGNGVRNKRVDMAYNAVNQLTLLSRYSDGNGVAETDYVYDNNRRLIQLSHRKGSNVIASYDYSYDDANRLARTVSSNDGSSDFSYDKTNQLTGTDHSSQVDEAYSYDANGNRTNSGYQTGTNNQLLSDGTYNYQYDREGNRTLRTEIATGKVTEYVWDYRNRLTTVLFKDAGGVVTKTIEYLYDVNNQRIGKKIDGQVTERYVLDRNQIALVFDGQGNQTHRYLYGTAIDQVLADETPTRTVWALTDNQGTVRDLIDDGGNVVEHFNYDSFGNLVSSNTPNSQLSTLNFRYGYTGREWDGETDQYYYRARYYDAGVGRFISEDPIGFGGGDSNLSRYVGNSPTNYIDPSGLCRTPSGGNLPHGTIRGLAMTGVGDGDTRLIELLGYGIAGLIGLGKTASDGFSDFLNYLPTIVRHPDEPYPLLPYPNPDRNRLHLGNSDVIRAGNPGDVPHGTPGFNEDRLVPPITYLPGATRDDSLFVRYFESSSSISGGAYGHISANGGEVHHMPANSISPLSTYSGPAIRMDKNDHRLTASWGRSKAAQKYREQQRQLIEKGKFIEAQQMDIDDIKSKFGSKYDKEIQDMLNYTNTIDPNRLTP
jgi:RHS repeat-associated protein